MSFFDGLVVNIVDGDNAAAYAAAASYYMGNFKGAFVSKS